MHSPDRHTVLIVDDEQFIADTLAVIFGRAGYRVKAVYSAEAALALCSSWPPHLAILDIMLPGTNGLELSRCLKQRCPECRILLLSGHSEAADLLEADRNSKQVWRVLPKPTPPDELLARARELLQA